MKKHPQPSRPRPPEPPARADEAERAARQASIRRILWGILLANFAVAVLKYGYGIWSGLVSVKADGLHSFTDGSSNLIGLLALRLAAAPPDEGHPYGHRKIEVAASLAIGIMILFGMAEIVRAVIDAALHGKQATFGVEGFLVAGGTLAVNLTVAAVEARAGRRLNSMILTADARHTLSDSLATIMVMVGMGFMWMGYPRADLVAASIVVVLIVAAALTIFRAGMATLLDQAQIDPERIREVAAAVPGVAACHAVRSRGQPDAIFVDLHLLVDPELTVRQGHQISHEAARRVRDAFPAVEEVLVHVEPWDDPDEPVYERKSAG